MTILGKSIDQNCTVTDGPCCHATLDTSNQYDYEISFSSTRANWSALYHTADETVAAQCWDI
jgi:hypothetical protein